MPAPSLSLSLEKSICQSAPVDVEEALFSLFEHGRSLKVPEQDRQDVNVYNMRSCDIMIFIVLVNTNSCLMNNIQGSLGVRFYDILH